MVKIRLSGDHDEVRNAIEAIERSGVMLVHKSRPYKNRREPGVRMYAEIEKAETT